MTDESREPLCSRVSAALKALGYDAPVIGETSDGEAMMMICGALEDLARLKGQTHVVFAGNSTTHPLYPMMISPDSEAPE